MKWGAFRGERGNEMEIRYTTRVKKNDRAWEDQNVKDISEELDQAIKAVLMAMPKQNETIKYHEIHIEL